MVLSCLNLYFIFSGPESYVLVSESEFLGLSLLGLTFYSNSERVTKNDPNLRKVF
jgi:hypothetical protein